MPALQTRRLRHRSCSKCASHKVKKPPKEERATGFTKTAKWHDCDKSALLLWHMSKASNAPMLWGYAASRREHHMLDWAGRSSSADAPSSAAGTAAERPLALTHETWPAPCWSTTTLTGRSSLGWSTAKSSEHHAALLRQNGAWQKRKRWALVAQICRQEVTV